MAFGPQCTHLGCAYHWEEGKNEFLCPCHTSLFCDRWQGDRRARRRGRSIAIETKVEGNKLLLGQLQDVRRRQS